MHSKVYTYTYWYTKICVKRMWRKRKKERKKTLLKSSRIVKKKKKKDKMDKLFTVKSGVMSFCLLVVFFL